MLITDSDDRFSNKSFFGNSLYHSSYQDFKSQQHYGYQPTPKAVLLQMENLVNLS